MRKLGIGALVATAALAPSTVRAQVARAEGYFVLTSATGNRGATATQLGAKNLAGISLRREWSSLNPQDGVYDFTYLDKEVGKAAAAGKAVQLRVLAGTHAPAWLYPAGARLLQVKDPQQPGSIHQMPVPWDPVMLDRWGKLVATLGGRYAAQPALALVHMTGPTGFSGEMHLPDEVTALPDWAPVKMVEAWRQAVGAFDIAFPQQVLALNLATVDTNSDLIMETVAAEAAQRLGPRAAFQHNALSAKTTSGFLPHELVFGYALQGYPTGYQMLCPSSDPRFGGKYFKAIQTAMAAKARYLELYPGDVGKIAPGSIP